jgi:hypothetical protein
VSVTNTGTGNNVLSASPTLTGTVDAAAVTLSSTLTLNAGTANGVAYLNGSKALTSGSALVFDGTNLGIGTSSPIYKLDVAGNIRALNSGADSTVIVTAPTDSYAPFISWGVSGIRNSGILGFPAGEDSLVYRSAANSFSTGTELFRITIGGNVGIGTSSPGVKLDVAGEIRSLVSGGTPAVYLNNGSTQHSIQNNSGAFTFYNSGVERMRLTAAGDLGIGTTSPGAMLDVAGNGRFGANNQVRLGSGTFAVNIASVWASVGRLDIGTTSASDISFFANNTERFRIESNGSIRAGATGALATTATDGFLYVPTCAGTPTGTPTAITGMAPIVVNTTNNKLYFYSGGAWRDAGP